MSSTSNTLNFSKPPVGVPTADGDFKESEHPRNEKGEFGGNGNNSKGSENVKKTLNQETENGKIKQIKNLIKSGIKAGKYPTNLNISHQNRHILGTKEYVTGRSILTARPIPLIKRHSGNGDPLLNKNGEWKKKERFANGDIIGIYKDIHGNESTTSNGILHYSKRGIHVVPSNPEQR